METRTIEYRADDRDLVGTMVRPDGAGPWPGVLVFHEGPGLDHHAKRKAEQLADLGFLAFAADYHGGGVRLPQDELVPRIMELMAAPERIRALAQAALDVLVAEPGVDADRLAAIGFCFGGTSALELARGGAPLRAVVGFHSGLNTTSPAQPGAVQGAVLVCIGADDPMVPAEQRAAFEEEMRAAGADYRINVYGGAVHSFTNVDADAYGSPAIKYHGPTDARSWRAMLDVFHEQLQTG